MYNAAIYAGTFDPFTLGHLDIVERASKLFGRVLIAVADPRHKTPLLPQDVRVMLVEESVRHLPNVEVKGFCKLLVEFAREEGIRVVVRGIRAVSDYEYEMKMAWMNKKLYPELETVFLLSSEKYAYLSSSFVKEIFSLGGDVSNFVPAPVAAHLQRMRRGGL
ncbi:MAG: pantetheine-phosphate adenylyltransferase [Thermotogae bacterium]|nr:pantetheine-phosphate adenylyltransferase [Thermotogota bacterium]